MVLAQVIILIACVILVLFVENKIIKWFFSKMDGCGDIEDLALVILLIFSVGAVLGIIMGTCKFFIDQIDQLPK